MSLRSPLFMRVPVELILGLSTISNTISRATSSPHRHLHHCRPDLCHRCTSETIQQVRTLRACTSRRPIPPHHHLHSIKGRTIAPDASCVVITSTACIGSCSASAEHPLEGPLTCITRMFRAFHRAFHQSPFPDCALRLVHELVCGDASPVIPLEFNSKTPVPGPLKDPLRTLKRPP